MDHYTMKALWIYWTRGDDEVELTDEESSDSDEVAKIFRIETNVFDFETPLCRAFMKFNYLLQIDPDTDNGAWEEPTPVRHHCEPFNYKNGCSEWTTCSWKDDGYCNEWNLPRAYIVGNILRYQDLEWYEALKDSKLKEEALKNKAIMEGMIDEDDESSNEGWRRWDNFENTNRDNEERCEVFDDHELPVCYIRRFEMVKYSFRDDGERPFLETARAMIDVFNKKITLRVGDDEVIFDMDQSIKRSPAEDDECYGIDDLDDAINAEAQELLANDKSDSFLLKGLEKSIDQSDLESCESFECEVVDDSDSGEPIRRIEYVNTPYPVAQNTTEPNKVKSEQLYSAIANEIDEKKPELKILPQLLEYAYLILPNSDRTRRSRKYNIHLSLWDFFLPTNVVWIMQRTSYFSKNKDAVNDNYTNDMVEDFMEVFMDDFSVFCKSFDCCLDNLDMMLARCEEINLVLNWKKCHFMVKEGIVLGHKIFRAGFEVDRAKINVIAKFPYPTNVKGVRSFLGHAGFY
ncbi:hypothetical protein Tco_1522309 [Tanacetum coccineum]